MRRRMDVVIAGVPKSGTSMLCNAMTVPGRAVVLYEPIRGRFRMERLRDGRQPGLPGPEYPRLGPQAREMGGQRGFRRLYTQGGRMGARARGPAGGDLRHVALWTYETNQRIPWDLDYRRQRLLASAEAVMELPGRTLPTGSRSPLQGIRREPRVSRSRSAKGELAHAGRRRRTWTVHLARAASRGRPSQRLDHGQLGRVPAFAPGARGGAIRPRRGVLLCVIQ